MRVVATVLTTCDRTLEPTELELEFGDSELLSGPNNPEVSVQDWTLDLARYTERALPNEVPMQVFSPGTEPVHPEGAGRRGRPALAGPRRPLRLAILSR